jgi:hypothetical protein
MAIRSGIRASDQDRELVAERLRLATGDGRLLPGELEDRLTAAFSARTHGQLSVLVADLPGPDSERRGLPIWARASLGVAGAVGALTAAAVAALLFALIACASAAWMVFERAVLGRGGGRDRRRGHPGKPAAALHRPEPPALHRPPPRNRLPRGGRALLP